MSRAFSPNRSGGLGWGLILVLAFIPSFAAAAPARYELNPANTYAVIVGVVRWENPDITAFSPRRRKDRELYEVLRSRGVPAGNMALLLDEKATLANIRGALGRLVAKAASGSTFLFYYAGHGGLLSDGGSTFLSYDAAAGREFRASEVGGVLRQHFRGARVILMADCCHSGGLAAVARDLASARIPAASVTSAEASNLSSGNWTFTQTVIDALGGESLLDANEDGKITLAELNGEVAKAMKYLEQQKSGFSCNGIRPMFSLARTRKGRDEFQRRYPLGEYVLAPDKDTVRPARIVGQKGGAYAVEFYDYSDKRVVHLPASRLKKIRLNRYPVGQELQAQWSGRLYPARVLKVKDDFHLIKYTHDGREWDEWVLADRLKPNPQP